MIEWTDTDEERVAQLKANGAIDTNQTISMESIQFYVKDVQATVNLWKEVLQLPEPEQHEQFISLHLPNIRLDFYDEVAATAMTLGHLNEGAFGVTLIDTNRTKETLVFPGAFIGSIAKVIV